ncbi:DUF2306 domain-containing protein [Saccharothrix variisporea]|uniref:DUF2306 domain-containing protein n=1 Tax=Saccharothrix variisporea TaxID=543527 RepID=UPI000EAEC9EC|nr:DUF2306 domain-containing protein [Saccharothrix variisporea]
MLRAPVVIGGIPIPDDHPVFLAVLAVHVAAGLTAVLAGGVAAALRKRPGWHPRAGRVFLWAVAVVFGSLVVLSVLRWPHNTHLLAIGTVTFTLAVAGFVARRRGALRVHAVCMAGAYTGLLTGFYVDNGENLPLWRDLPHITYWLLPTAVGVPLLVLALRRNFGTP